MFSFSLDRKLFIFENPQLYYYYWDVRFKVIENPAQVPHGLHNCRVGSIESDVILVSYDTLFNSSTKKDQSQTISVSGPEFKKHCNIWTVSPTDLTYTLPFSNNAFTKGCSLLIEEARVRNCCFRALGSGHWTFSWVHCLRNLDTSSSPSWNKE